MTGQGQGRTQFGSTEITVEVRAVNNRHLKIHMRVSDAIGSLEPQIESLVRANLRRGSLQLNVQLSGGEFASGYQLQPGVIESYFQQCAALSAQLGVESAVSLADLLPLPGVVLEPRSATQRIPSEDLAKDVLETIRSALDCLNRMRAVEGGAMQTELLRQLDRLAELSTAIETRAPAVIDEYRMRLTGKLTKALAEIGHTLVEADVVREVLIMADKADIREEIVRLRSHLQQFRQLLSAEESQGRKLDFLIQEMFREANTIGSKAGDAEMAQRVVDMKTIIEQMRELVQNVE
ncbi:MAG: YicC/YloC family endoribonuclease [Pirellulaceae bacterium]